MKTLREQVINSIERGILVTKCGELITDGKMLAVLSLIRRKVEIEYDKDNQTVTVGKNVIDYYISRVIAENNITTEIDMKTLEKDISNSGGRKLAYTYTPVIDNQV